VLDTSFLNAYAPAIEGFPRWAEKRGLQLNVDYDIIAAMLIKRKSQRAEDKHLFTSDSKDAVQHHRTRGRTHEALEARR
jgi:hypothetical protein